MSDDKHKFGDGYIDIDENESSTGTDEEAADARQTAGEDVESHEPADEALSQHDDQNEGEYSESSPYQGSDSTRDDLDSSDIEDIEEEYEEEHEEEYERSKKPLVIGAVAAAVIIVVGSSFFMFGGGAEQTAAPQQTQQFQPPQQGNPGNESPERPGGMTSTPNPEPAAASPQERLAKLESAFGELSERFEGTDSRFDEIEEVLIRVAREVRAIGSSDSQGSVSSDEVEQQVESTMRNHSQTVSRQISALESSVSEIQSSLRAMERQSDSQHAEPAKEVSVNSRSNTTPVNRVSGSDLHIIAVAEGLVFLRRLDLEDSDPNSELSLEPGEQLRGYGVVTRVTGGGCIHVGGEQLEPINGTCS